MDGKSEILQFVCDAIREYNSGEEKERRITPVPGAVLIGEGSPLDSLGVVTLASIVEEHLERRIHETVSVMDIFGAADAAAFDVASLVERIVLKLGRAAAG